MDSETREFRPLPARKLDRLDAPTLRSLGSKCKGITFSPQSCGTVRYKILDVSAQNSLLDFALILPGLRYQRDPVIFCHKLFRQPPVVGVFGALFQKSKA